MGTIVTMTLDDEKKMPPISEKRLKEIEAFEDKPDEGCPVPTKEQLSKFKPWYEVHPNGSSTA